MEIAEAWLTTQTPKDLVERRQKSFWGRFAGAPCLDFHGNMGGSVAQGSSSPSPNLGFLEKTLLESHAVLTQKKEGPKRKVCKVSKSLGDVALVNFPPQGTGHLRPDDQYLIGR